MDEAPRYVDIRAALWKRSFEAANDYDAYLAAADPARSQRWRDLAAQMPELTPEQKRRLAVFGRQMRVLFYSGIWCGDCVRQGPMVRRIAEACGSGVELRFIDRDASAELTDELRILGARRVPVAVFLSEDWFEAGRYGDRTLTVYRSKAARELGPACDTGLVAPPAEQLEQEQEEWVSLFERMLAMLRLSPMLRERYGD